MKTEGKVAKDIEDFAKELNKAIEKGKIQITDYRIAVLDAGSNWKLGPHVTLDGNTEAKDTHVLRSEISQVTSGLSFEGYMVKKFMD